MRPEIRKYLYDIQQACDSLKTFTARKTFEDYAGDALLRSAVERQFTIIGEALTQALRREPGLASRISHCSRIVSFRNRLIHVYGAISDRLVWGVVENSLPVLQSEIESLLGEDT
jgi:uncharacterized protein with HEPN domain